MANAPFEATKTLELQDIHSLTTDGNVSLLSLTDEPSEAVATAPKKLIHRTEQTANLSKREEDFFKNLNIGMLSHIYAPGELPAPAIPIPVPNYKGPLFPSVDVLLTPQDSDKINQHYHHLIAEHPESSPQDRKNLLYLAAADIYIDKYQEALSNQEMAAAKLMPESMRGPFLCASALQDGVVLGTAKEVIKKVIAGGALGDLTSGTAVGLAFGKIVAKLASNVNPWVRAGAVLLQAGGIGLALQQIGAIGKEGIDGFSKCMPSLDVLLNNPSAENFRNATQIVQRELGPAGADASLTALGFAAAHGIEKAAGIVKPGTLAEKAPVTARQLEEIHPQDGDVSIRLAGSKFLKHDGPWKAIGERPSADVVKQIHPDSCISACVEMITGGKLKQTDVMDAIGMPSDISLLPKKFGPEWRAGAVSDDELGVLLQRGKPFMAELKRPTVLKAHEVVIDGLNGKGELLVRDPSEGTKYRMTMEEFRKFWCGRVAFRVER